MSFCNKTLFAELPGLRTSDIGGIVSMMDTHRTSIDDPAASEVDPFAYADFAAENELKPSTGEVAADGLPTAHGLRHLDLPTRSEMVPPTKGITLMRLRACVERRRATESYGAYVCNAAESVEGAERGVLTLFSELSQIPFLQLFHIVTALEEFLILANEEDDEDDEGEETDDEESEQEEEEVQEEEEEEEDLYDDEKDGFKKTEMGFHWMESTQNFNNYRYAEQLLEAAAVVPEMLSLILEHRHSVQSVRDAVLAPPPPPPPPPPRPPAPRKTKEKQVRTRNVQ